MLHKKAKKSVKTITAILEAENGFTSRMKLPVKNLPLVVNIPFLYRIRVTSPVVGDYMDIETSPIGRFELQRRTKTQAFYKLINLYQAKENLK